MSPNLLILSMLSDSILPMPCSFDFAGGRSCFQPVLSVCTVILLLDTSNPLLVALCELDSPRAPDERAAEFYVLFVK